MESARDASDLNAREATLSAAVSREQGPRPMLSAASVRRSAAGTQAGTRRAYFAGGLASEMSEMPPTRFAISILACMSENP
jgi:hypothetical protein